MKVLILTLYGRLGASSRMRILQFLPALEREGLRCEVLPLIDDAQLQARYERGGYGPLDLLRAYGRRLQGLMRRHRYDVVWIEKEALPWMPAGFELKLLQGTPYILDFDDAIFHNYDQHSSMWVRRLLGNRIDKLMKGARLVIGGNEYLAQRARDAGASWVEVVPTVIDLDRYEVKDSSSDLDKSLRIVWIGSPSTVRYLDILREPLARLSQSYDFKFRVIGGTVSDFSSTHIELVPWSENTEVASIRDGDVGVMPLHDSPWERGKCGYKLIQYMACGLPVVASPVGVNKTLVQNGKNGFLAETAEEWGASLVMLLENSAERARLGAYGRTLVEASYCTQKVGPRLAKLIRGVGEHV